MTPQSFQLVMRSGPTPGKIFDINKNEMTIGRDISNDIVINDAEVSRKHARLIAQTGGYVLEDTGSTNGTFVNGQRLMGPHLLRPGELVLLGENVGLGYEATQFDPDATIAAAVAGVPSIPPSPEPRPVSSPPLPEPAYTSPEPYPQQGSYPQPQPVSPPPYVGSVPPGPADVYEAPVEERRSNRNLLLAGCGCLIVLLCLLAVGAYAFDSLNLYCVGPFRSISVVFGLPCP
ncbi:MAG TPA: FHA domain-containing protein [Anaerolineales bacterium]